MSTITFLALKTKLRAELWPSPGEPKNLRTSHDKSFITGMIELQTYLERLRVNHTLITPFANTFFNCGKTVLAAPKGIIRSVRTVLVTDGDEDFCDKIHYEQTNPCDLENWAECMAQYNQPNAVGAPNYPAGFKQASSETDYQYESTTVKLNRGERGLWAISKKYLYLVPWIQSDESVVVNYDGIKNDWVDADVLDQTYWDPEVEEALKAYILFKHEFYHGCDRQKLRDTKEIYDRMLADLMWKEREETKEREHCDGDLLTPNSEEDEGIFMTGWYRVDTITQLKMISSKETNQVAHVSDFAGQPRIYDWNNASTEAPNDISIVQSDDGGTGRWIQRF